MPDVVQLNYLFSFFFFICHDSNSAVQAQRKPVREVPVRKVARKQQADQRWGRRLTPWSVEMTSLKRSTKPWTNTKRYGHSLYINNLEKYQLRCTRIYYACKVVNES